MTTGSNLETKATTGSGAVEPNHYLWAYFNVTIDPAACTVEAIPARKVADHWNVLVFLEQGPCITCVKFVDMKFSPCGALLVDVELTNPFSSPDWTGFDVRGICMLSGSHWFPANGVISSDAAAGEGEVVNADGYTALYNIITAGNGPGGLGGYTKGKFSSPHNPFVTLSPYMRFITPDAGNIRNAFYAGSSLTRTYEIELPDGNIEFGYAIDACWLPPMVTPIKDPMIDFPPDANCPEPWKIEVTQQPTGWGLTNQGGQTRLKIKVYDYQGKGSNAGPVLECPELWDGSVKGTWVSDGMDQYAYSYYKAVVQNTKHASAGQYKCLIAVEDNENASAPWWLDLTAYQMTTLEVCSGHPDHHQLWYFTGADLLTSQDVTNAVQVLQQAAAAGYEKVVLGDFTLGAIDLQNKSYYNNLQEFVKAAASLHIEVIPLLVGVGYSNPVLCHDPNLIEGQPVKDCLFKVNGNAADVVQDPATTITNGGFETHYGDVFTGWIPMDAGVGVGTFADTSIKNSGTTSIRFENYASFTDGNDRIRQPVTVKPWNCYAVSFWVRTGNASPTTGIGLRVLNSDATSKLHFLWFNIQQTQDWTHYYAIFNSQGNSTVYVYIGIWGGTGGRFWVDDVTIENAGLINVIRRAGTPFEVTSGDGSVIYQEGIDFYGVSDPLLGYASGHMGSFDLYHKRPVITLTPGSKIKAGDNLLVDYYHATFAYYLQTACCLTEESVYDIFENTLSMVNDLIHPTEVFIHIDELRVVNWCQLCLSKGKTPGQLLADATQRINQIAISVNPTWELIVWSDMYDPNHNAVDNYYLANGTLANSSAGLPVGWDIANWHWPDKAASTLAFFNTQGNRQILCGFYDEPGPDYSIGKWLDMSKQYTGVYAVMYTTWHQDFSALEAWAKAVKAWDELNW